MTVCHLHVNKNEVDYAQFFSQIFDRSGRSETDLLLCAFSISPSLGIGITSAIFHSNRKEHVSIERFNKDAILGRIGARQSLITR